MSKTTITRVAASSGQCNRKDSRTDEISSVEGLEGVGEVVIITVNKLDTESMVEENVGLARDVGKSS